MKMNVNAQKEMQMLPLSAPKASFGQSEVYEYAINICFSGNNDSSSVWSMKHKRFRKICFNSKILMSLCENNQCMSFAIIKS